MEFYDFIIYGVFTQSIAAAFFPVSDPLVSLALSFAVFAGGYLARPLGGLLFGTVGDQAGRRKVFLLSVLLISGSTTLMGLLPTYATLGAGATFLMIALRLIQGFCVGGELPCSIVYVVETAPRRAGFVCGVLIFCVNTGVALAALVSLALSTFLTPEDLAAYGWRIGFLIGGLTGLGSYVLRRTLTESPEFAAMKSTASKRPMREVFRERPLAIGVGIGTTAATAGFNALLFAYLPSYLTRVLHYDPPTASLAQNVGLAVLSVALPVAGFAGDLIPRRYILAVGACLLAGLAYPFFHALVQHSASPILLFAMAGLAAALCNGVFASVLADLFPTKVRFSGVAVSYNLSMTIFGGLTPLLASVLVAGTGVEEAPAYIMVMCAVVALTACLAMPWALTRTHSGPNPHHPSVLGPSG